LDKAAETRLLNLEETANFFLSRKPMVHYTKKKIFFKGLALRARPTKPLMIR